jgi:hypothetical protein
MEHASDSLQSDSVYSSRAEESNSNTDAEYSDNNTLVNTNGYASRTRRTYEEEEDNDQEDEEEDDDEEEITPAELIEKLQQCWLNEKLSPELLEHKTPVVECIIEQIKHMESNIKSAKKGDFRIAIHKLEVTYLLLILLKVKKFL